MKPRAKRQPKKRVVLRGRDPVSQLYRAVLRYVKSKKGSILLIGGIEIQEWPQDRALMYRVAIRCMGRKPELEESKQ